MTRLQPYWKLSNSFLVQLTNKGSFYLVSQSYDRGQEETDHTRKSVLFTPYKDPNEAHRHFLHLRDRFAAVVDIRKSKVARRMSEICSGKTEILPFLALAKDLQTINHYLDLQCREQIRSWVRKHRQGWNIREPNSLQPSFYIVMGEPAVNIKWGSHSVTVKLEELERL